MTFIVSCPEWREVKVIFPRGAICADRMKSERTALALIEEALQLLRAAPISVYALYAAGTVPFSLALFNFCTEMSYSRNAERECAASAFTVALAYLWMKGLQAFCCRELVHVYTGNITQWWKPRAMLAIWSRQIAFQPLGLIVKPLAWLLLIPGACIATFFQNLTILGGTGPNDFKKSWDLACLWPKQSFAALSLLSLLAPIVLVNLYALIVAIPFAFKAFLGIESFLTRSSTWLFSYVLLITLAAITYFLIDLLVKSIDVVRCCEGESLTSGEDLLRRLHNLQKSPGAVRAP
jgi:hypothetical protein